MFILNYSIEFIQINDYIFFWKPLFTKRTAILVKPINDGCFGLNTLL